MKEWKKECNHILRVNIDDDSLPSGNFYKKINDAWSAPNDGKHYDPDYKKAWRK